MTDIIYWVWLAQKNGAGRADAVRLLEHFPGGAKDIFAASDEELFKIKDCSESFLRRLTNRDLSDAEKILEFCFMNGIRIIPCVSENYPKRLHELYNKPIVLYVRGMIEDLNERFCVSIIGTRSMSAYGKHMAFTLARQLIGYGAIIVSGAAYGVDSAANNTAVYLEEPTVAVLGSGVNVPYPAKNKGMLDYIAKNGMVISEFPPNTAPSGGNFPIRNRIISGLSDALIVVEAGEKSGTQITARFAEDQGRKVYAVPGNVGAPNSIGTNRMIRDGAKAVTCAEDVIEDFAGRFELAKIPRIVNSDRYMRYEYNHSIPIQPENIPMSPKQQDKMEATPISQFKASSEQRSLPDIHSPDEFRGTAKKTEPAVKAVRPKPTALPIKKKSRQTDAKQREAVTEGFDELQRRVFDAIPDGMAVSSDKIISVSGLPTEDVLSTLTILELLSAVKALPGDLYRKTI